MVIYTILCLQGVSHLYHISIVKFVKKKIVDFRNLMTIEFCRRLIFKILIVLSLGSCEVPYKIWARSVQSFCRLLGKNKQTGIQTSKAYIRIHDQFTRFNRNKTKTSQTYVD